MWYEYPCYLNDISRDHLVRYFCGSSDTEENVHETGSSGFWILDLGFINPKMQRKIFMSVGH